ncbi:MAG: hypothetical protein ACRC2T_03320 [Thermoguttaceae bacterium]
MEKPNMYRAVSWRCTTSANDTGVGVAFNTPDGEVIRLWLSHDCAEQLVSSMNEMLQNYRDKNCQSSISAGILSDAVSVTTVPLSVTIVGTAPKDKSSDACHGCA